MIRLCKLSLSSLGFVCLQRQARSELTKVMRFDNLHFVTEGFTFGQSTSNFHATGENIIGERPYGILIRTLSENHINCANYRFKQRSCNKTQLTCQRQPFKDNISQTSNTCCQTTNVLKRISRFSCCLETKRLHVQEIRAQK